MPIRCSCFPKRIATFPNFSVVAQYRVCVFINIHYACIVKQSPVQLISDRINCVSSASFSGIPHPRSATAKPEKGGQANDFLFIYGFMCYFIS